MGTKNAFLNGKRSYTEIVLPDKSEYSIGQLLQFKMMEMMYLARILGVNAFEQLDGLYLIIDMPQHTVGSITKGVQGQKTIAIFVLHGEDL